MEIDHEGGLCMFKSDYHSYFYIVQQAALPGNDYTSNKEINEQNAIKAKLNGKLKCSMDLKYSWAYQQCARKT